MNTSRLNKKVSNCNNYCFGLVVTIIFIIGFFELVPERSIWSIPIKAEDEHIFAFPGLGGYSLVFIQKQEKDEKQCCQRRRIMIVDDELDITFTFKMILEENGFNKQVDTYNEPLSALQTINYRYCNASYEWIQIISTNQTDRQ